DMNSSSLEKHRKILGLEEKDLIVLGTAGILSVEDLASVKGPGIRIGVLSTLPKLKLARAIQKARWLIEPHSEVKPPDKNEIPRLKAALTKIYIYISEYALEHFSIFIDYEKREAWDLEGEAELLKKLRGLKEDQSQQRLVPIELSNIENLYNMKKHLIRTHFHVASRSSRELYNDFWTADLAIDILDELRNKGINYSYDVPTLDEDIEPFFRGEVLEGRIITNLSDDYWTEIGRCEYRVDEVVSPESLYPLDYVLSNFDSLLTFPGHDKLALL
ncbi:MAG: hypothetical protein QXP38_04275, partial [Nitrososphaerota archaeon]